MPYINALYCASIPSLADHREQLSCKFLKLVSQPSSCLHTLLTTPRDPTIYNLIKICKQISMPPSCTTKYQTLISYALAHYQIS